MTIVLSLIGFAALFALAAVLRRPRTECSHDCGACGAACGLSDREERT